MDAVKASQLTKTFINSATNKPVTALSGISLTAKTNRLTALTGPDGAGKTTFMRLVCGLMKQDGGNLFVLGRDVSADPQSVQDRLSYMPQRFGLYEDLSVQENLNLYADLHSIPEKDRSARFTKLLSMTGMLPFTGRLAGKLSGGMKQKLGLACTLVRIPELLLLDEPSIGVDPLSRREFWEILHTLVEEEHVSILVNTSYMDEAEQCDFVYVLHKGSILASGSPAELRRHSSGKCFVIQPPATVPPRIIQAALLDDTEHVLDAVPEGGGIRFITADPSKLGELALWKKFPSVSVHAVSERLEDSFMMYQREAAGTGGETVSQPVNTLSGKPHGRERIIEVHDLVRRFGDFTAVDHTSFNVYKGEIFGLLGPNGAGKSTTFRMLCGLLPASSGTASVAGVNLRTARAQARAHIGYVAQKFSLYGTLSVKENLFFFGGAYGLPFRQIKERVEAVTRQFGLEAVADADADTLPGGYKQRLSMAAALLHNPPILFLDEPTSGIDPLARRTFWRQITALASEGTTVIITTHFMEEAEYCDRMMIQDQGRMIAIGTPDEIRHQGGDSPTMNEAFIHIVEAGRRRQETSS